MISINKPKTVPSVLNDKTAQHGFQKNIDANSYVGKDIYKKVKKELEEIYHCKCAYCETDIKAGGYNHVEHYRPKNDYYWLAYSWDNLLLSCPVCNTHKATKFLIKGIRLEYNGEPLSKLHSKTHEYDNQEQPLIVNPEQKTQDYFDENLFFDINAKINGKTEELQETIKICKLNRKDLVGRRIKILNKLNFRYTLQKNTKDKQKLFKDIVAELENSIENHDEYIAWLKFLLKCIK